MLLFMHYPGCSTCKKAKAFLDEHGVSYTERNIIDQRPTQDEIRSYLKLGIEIKKMFNSSGVRYRTMQLKDKLLEMSEDEKIELLASDGILVKRPLLIGDDFAVSGFKEDVYIEKLKLKSKKKKK